MSGKIVALPSTERPGKVEIIMTNGDDAAITYMKPEIALEFVIDLLRAIHQTEAQ